MVFRFEKLRQSLAAMLPLSGDGKSAGRAKETLHVKRQVGSGRPKKTTPAQDEMLLHAVSAKEITTAQEVVGSLFIFSLPSHYLFIDRL